LPDIASNDQKRRRGRRRGFVACPTWLASYLCRLRTLRVHLSVLGVVSTPPHWFNVTSIDSLWTDSLTDLILWWSQPEIEEALPYLAIC
jgi:hypothetical protein